jgi:hypothetical protein
LVCYKKEKTTEVHGVFVTDPVLLRVLRGESRYQVYYEGENMAHVLIMPRQGNTVESCLIQERKVKEGDSVQADTTAAVVETD